MNVSPRRSAAERALERIVKHPGRDGCWTWTGYSVRGKTQREVTPILHEIRGDRYLTVSAVRVLWKAEGRPLSKYQFLRRGEQCQPTCVRPSHFRTTTILERKRADAQSGRSTLYTAFRKLDPEHVLAIRSRRHPHWREVQRLAAKYDVTESTIYNILSGRTWKAPQYWPAA